MLTVILGYLAFTSGLVFEVSKSKQVGQMDIPYAIPFSNERVGLIGLYTEGDIDCAEWLVANSGGTAIIADYFGHFLIVGLNGAGVSYQSLFREDLGVHYLFLGTWNDELDAMILGWDEGIRTYREIPDVSGGIEVFRSGRAVVYKMG